MNGENAKMTDERKSVEGLDEQRRKSVKRRFLEIPAKNLYRILTYVFAELERKEFRNLGSEEFENTLELLAAILADGLAYQVQKGLMRRYVGENEDLRAVRGRVNMAGSIRLKMARQRRLNCDFDELSEDVLANRILRTILRRLLVARSGRTAAVRNRETRRKLKKLLQRFGGIGEVELARVDWRHLSFGRNERSYRFLMWIAEMITREYLWTSEDGVKPLARYTTETRASWIYEKFLLEYFRRHFGNRVAVRAEALDWNMEGVRPRLWPTMQTDVLLTDRQDPGRVLIIDAKTNLKILERNSLFGGETYHTGHLYQLYTYVKNYDRERSGKVAGLLLYAQAEEQEVEECEVVVDGNKLGVGVVDLRGDFEEIRRTLDGVAERFLAGGDMSEAVARA